MAVGSAGDVGVASLGGVPGSAGVGVAGMAVGCWVSSDPPQAMRRAVRTARNRNVVIDFISPLHSYVRHARAGGRKTASWATNRGPRPASGGEQGVWSSSAQVHGDPEPFCGLLLRYVGGWTSTLCAASLASRVTDRRQQAITTNRLPATSTQLCQFQGCCDGMSGEALLKPHLSENSNIRARTALAPACGHASEGWSGNWRTKRFAQHTLSKSWHKEVPPGHARIFELATGMSGALMPDNGAAGTPWHRCCDSEGDGNHEIPRERKGRHGLRRYPHLVRHGRHDVRVVVESRDESSGDEGTCSTCSTTTTQQETCTEDA